MKPTSPHRLVRSGSRAAWLFANSIAALLASAVVARAGTNVLIADDFNNNSIDGSKWVTLNPNSQGSNGETAQPNGYIFSKNRATINTVAGASWNPVNSVYGGQHLTGIFYMAADSNRSQGDNVEILTRSDNTNNGGATVAAKYGVSFSLGEGSATPGLGITGYSTSTWTQAPTAIGQLFAGTANTTTNNNYQTPVSFDIWDFGDGRYVGTYTNMTNNTGGTSAGFTASVMGTATVTGAFSSQVNQINMHCRERSNSNANAHQSNFDDLVIAAPSSWVGGDGTWSGANWAGGNGVSNPSGAGTAVVFGKPGTGATVTLDASSTLGAMAFYPDVNVTINSINGSTLTMDSRPMSASTYSGGTVDTGALAGITVIGGTHVLNPNITLTNSATLVVFNSGDSLTLGGSISGTGYTSLYAVGLTSSVDGNCLTKGGAGTLVLAGANTYGGTTRVTLGTLTVANTLALQNSTLEMNPAFTGTLGFGTGITTVSLGGLTGSRNMVLLNADNNGVNLAVGNNNSSSSYSGILSDLGGLTGGGLTKTGTGTLTLSGSNTYTGATGVGNGTLKLDFSVAASATNIIGTGSSLVLGGGTLNLTGKSSTSNSQTFAGLTVNPGSSVVTLAANATGNPLALALNAITRNPGGIVSFSLPTGTQSASNGITATSSNDASGILGGWATVGGADFASINSGNVVAYSGYSDVTRLTSGPQVIANAPTANIRLVEGSGSQGYITLGAATTTINTLNQSAVGGTSAATIDPAGGTWVINGILVAGGAGSLTIGTGTASGTIHSAGTELVVTNGSASVINSVVTDGSGSSSLIKSGAGTLTLGGVNTYTGATSVLAGVLKLAAAGSGAYTSLGTADAGTTVASGAALDLNGFSVNTAEALTLTGTGVAAGGALTNSSSSSATYAGLLTLGGNTSIVAASGSIILTQAGTITGSGCALTLDGAATGSSLAGSIATGAGTLTKVGSGTWTLLAANTYTGLTSVTAGGLILGVANAIPGAITVNGATALLDLGTHNDASSAVILDGGGSIAGSGGVLTSTADFALKNGTISAILGGASGLQKTTAGTVILSAVNSFSGATSITGGTLALGIANAIPAAITVNGASAGLSLGAYDNSSSAVTLDGGASITGSSGTLSSSTDFALKNGVVSAILGGQSGVQKTTAGIVTLTGSNTYVGPTTLSAGTLNINSDASLGLVPSLPSANLAFGASATLQFAAAPALNANRNVSIAGAATATIDTQANNPSIQGSIVGDGGLTKIGSGMLTLTGMNTYVGLTTLGAGTLNINSDAALGAVPASATTTVVFSASATLQFAADFALNANRILSVVSGASASFDTQANNPSIDGVIAGSGNLIKTGSGTLTLTGANTYAGTTSINVGTLQVNGSLGSGGLVSVPAGGTLNVGSGGMIARNVTVSGGILNLAGSLTTGSVLTVTAGTVTTTMASASVATVDCSAGTGMIDASSFPLTVTKQLNLPNRTSISLSGGTAFTLSGTNLANPASPRTLTASGGLLSIANAAYPMLGLLGKWTFDSQSAVDTSGNGYHGTEVNTPIYSTDTHTGTGYSLQLTGANYVKVDTGGSQTIFDGGSAMTTSAWVKGWPGTWNAFVCKNGESNGWQMRKSNTTSNLAWTTRGPSNGDMQGVTTTTSNGSWHMVTMTYDANAGANNKKIYVDGVLDSQATATGTITASTDMLGFGAKSQSGAWAGFFTGKLDDIYFYNRALSAAEIATAYTSVPSSSVDLSTTELAVSATSEVSLPAGPTSFGNLVLSGGGAVLTLSGTGATGVSLDNVSASNAATITGSVPLSLRGGNVSVDGPSVLAIAAAIVNGASPTSLVKLGSGTLTLDGLNTYTGNTTVTAGTLTLAANAALKFVVTDGSANKVTGAGTAYLDGNFSIDTTAVTVTSGTWPLIDVASKAFGSNFTVAGAGWTGSSSAWTKTEGTKVWTFSQASGTLTLSVAGYNAWATAMGLTGIAGSGSDTDPAPGADPDKDGRLNFQEYALDSNPRSSANEGKLVCKVATLADSSNVLTLTLPVRRAATFSSSGGEQTSAPIDGVVYTIQGSATLAAASWTLAVTEITNPADVAAIQAGLPPLSDVNGDSLPDWTYRSFRTPGTVGGASPIGFLRVKVTLP